MKNWKHYLPIIVIVLLAGFLRLYRLHELPPGVNRDEASIGYTAYSIVRTGRDEYGRFLPLSFQSFGDWKLPLYIYTTVPLVATLGMNELSVRLPSAIAGTLTVLLTYFLVIELLAGSTKSQASSTKATAFTSALLLAISPWHLHLSRVESESNVAVLFITSGLLLFFRSLNNRSKLLPWSALFFALTYYTYHGNHIFTTLFLIELVCFYRRELLTLRTWKTSLIVFLISVSIILSQTFHQADKTKISGISIFGDPTVVHTKIELPRNEHRNPKDLVARLVHNRLTYAVTTVTQNYLKSISAEFLFIKGGGNRAHNIEGFGNMYLLEAPFLLLGVMALFFMRQQKGAKLLLWWLAISPIAAAITKDAPHTNRMFAIFPALSITVALGLQGFLNSLKGWKLRRIIFLTLLALYLFSLITYLERYYLHFPRNEAQYWGLPYKELTRILNKVENQNKPVVISHPEYSPYIYLLFYSGYNPAKYQNETLRYPPTPDAFYHVAAFGRFEFRTPDWNRDSQVNKILVAYADDTPEEIKQSPFTKSTILPNGQPFFFAINAE